MGAARRRTAQAHHGARQRRGDEGADRRGTWLWRASAYGAQKQAGGRFVRGALAQAEAPSKARPGVAARQAIDEGIARIDPIDHDVETIRTRSRHMRIVDIREVTAPIASS